MNENLRDEFEYGISLQDEENLNSYKCKGHNSEFKKELVANDCCDLLCFEYILEDEDESI